MNFSHSTMVQIHEVVDPSTNDPNHLILALYILMFIYHGVNRGKSYRAPHKALLPHTIAGVLELSLFYSGYKISALAVVACFAHCITGGMLVKYLQKGYPPITRPAYQVGIFLRPVMILYAYYTGSQLWYHDAIMPIHSFIYARALFFTLGTAGPTSCFVENVNSKHIYSLAIWGGALAAVAHCSNVYAITVYVLSTMAIGKVNVWARDQKTLCRKEGREVSQIVRILHIVGLFAFPAPSAEVMQNNINDGPKIGYLPMDDMGRKWAAVGAL